MKNVAGLVEACERGGRKRMAVSLGFNQHKQKHVQRVNGVLTSPATVRD